MPIKQIGSNQFIIPERLFFDGQWGIFSEEDSTEEEICYETPDQSRHFMPVIPGTFNFPEIFTKPGNQRWQLTFYQFRKTIDAQRVPDFINLVYTLQNSGMCKNFIAFAHGQYIAYPEEHRFRSCVFIAKTVLLIRWEKYDKTSYMDEIFFMQNNKVRRYPGYMFAGLSAVPRQKTVRRLQWKKMSNGSLHDEIVLTNPPALAPSVIHLVNGATAEFFAHGAQSIVYRTESKVIKIPLFCLNNRTELLPTDQPERLVRLWNTTQPEALRTAEVVMFRTDRGKVVQAAMFPYLPDDPENPLTCEEIQAYSISAYRGEAGYSDGQARFLFDSIANDSASRLFANFRRWFDSDGKQYIVCVDQGMLLLMHANHRPDSPVSYDAWHHSNIRRIYDDWYRQRENICQNNASLIQFTRAAFFLADKYPQVRDLNVLQNKPRLLSICAQSFFNETETLRNDANLRRYNPLTDDEERELTEAFGERLHLEPKSSP